MLMSSSVLSNDCDFLPPSHISLQELKKRESKSVEVEVSLKDKLGKLESEKSQVWSYIFIFCIAEIVFFRRLPTKR